MELEVDDGASINNIGLNYRTITITAVNVAPTLNPITSPAPLFENSGQQTIDLGGIAAGAGRQQDSHERHDGSHRRHRADRERATGAYRARPGRGRPAGLMR